MIKKKLLYRNHKPYNINQAMQHGLGLYIIDGQNISHTFFLLVRHSVRHWNIPIIISIKIIMHPCPKRIVGWNSIYFSRSGFHLQREWRLRMLQFVVPGKGLKILIWHIQLLTICTTTKVSQLFDEKVPRCRCYEQDGRTILAWLISSFHRAPNLID